MAEEGGFSAPQPRLWRAVAKQARERQCGKVELRAPSWIPPGIWGPYVLAVGATLAVARKRTDCRVASLLAMTWKRETPAKRRASSFIQAAPSEAAPRGIGFASLFHDCTQIRTMSDDRDDQPGHGTQVHRVGALFFWPGRGPSSFRQDEKKMGGAFRRSWFANRPRRRV